MAKGKCHVLPCACYERGRADENEACAKLAVTAVDSGWTNAGEVVAQRIRSRRWSEGFTSMASSGEGPDA